MYIKLDDIIPNRFQPREVFDEEALNKLADSIRQHGVIEPILVRPISNKYEIVAGERRYKASIMAGLTKIPAIVRPMDDKESSILAFIENAHRSDVSAIEEARTMDRLLKSNNMTQDELAKEIGLNQSTIANKLRLLNLPMEVQESLMRNEISERHARSLLSVKDEAKQIELLEKIKERKMTVRELDSEIKSMNEGMNNFNNMGFADNNVGGNNGFNPLPNFDFGFNNNTNTNINANSTTNNNQSTEFNPSSYLNDNINEIFSTPSTPVTPEPVTPPAQNNSFTDFLNSYDSKYPLPPEDNSDGTTGGQSNVLNNVPETPNAQAEKSFTDYLNEFDNSPLASSITSSISEQQATPDTSSTPEQPADASFLNFLNDYDNKHPLPPEDETDGTTGGVDNYLNTASEVPSTPVEDKGFTDFLSNLNTNSNPITPSAPVTPEPVTPTVDNDIYSGFNKPVDNVTINNVNPPITSNMNNQYIENTANYVDVSKEQKITSVDEIINKLGDVVKEIKEKSIYKVDTDEINYDDIYQITIKIDKRDF